jgi:DNA polymerase III gamma/tau subunit
MEQLNSAECRAQPVSLARQMVRYLRNALMAKLGGEQTELLQISADERARAARTALLFTEEELTRNLQIVLRTFDDLNYRQEQRFHLELGTAQADPRAAAAADRGTAERRGWRSGRENCIAEQRAARERKRARPASRLRLSAGAPAREGVAGMQTPGAAAERRPETGAI